MTASNRKECFTSFLTFVAMKLTAGENRYHNDNNTNNDDDDNDNDNDNQSISIALFTQK